MATSNGECLDEFFGNSWCPEFSILRKLNFKTTLGYVKSQGEEYGEEIGIFFTDSGDIDSPREFEVLTKICHGTFLKDVISGNGIAGSRRVIWMDERSSSPAQETCGPARPHENPLTATGLFRALIQARFDHDHLPDASRRLIYVMDLSPACIHALAATVSYHQAVGLRDAIYKYLEFQTSIAVKITSAGLLTFQLDLHLPFFILNKSPPPKEDTGKIRTQPRRRWTDLSFLNLDKLDFVTEESNDGEIWGIQDAQISCVVAGYDDWRWVGYGFVDSEVDGILAESSEVDLLHDRIAAGELHSNYPIQKPRDYWVKVFEIRIRFVKRQWDYLIHKLELGVEQYMKENPLILSRCSQTAQERATRVEEAFDTNSQMMEVLRRIEGVLSDTIKAWESFISSTSHIGLFRSTDTASISKHSKRSLRAIKIIFEGLEGNHDKIKSLKQCCCEFSSTLKLRLILENKTTADQNGTTSEFTVSVLYPPALAAAIFSMQESAVPFELTPRAFIIALILLFIIIRGVRFVGRCILPRWTLLRKISAWSKNKKLDEVHESLDIELGDTDFPVANARTDKVVTDEERHDPRTCGTRAMLGPRADE